MTVLPRSSAARNRSALLALVALAVAALLLTALTALSAPAAEAGSGKRFRNWTSPKLAKIHPGVQMYTRGGQCTANFVFTDRRGNVFVGYSAHCAGKGAATDTNGCNQQSYPIGTTVEFRRGGSLFGKGRLLAKGRLRYSSWITMRKRNTTKSNQCEYNDFALVKLKRKDRRKVNPSVPFFGGPTGIDRDGTRASERLYTYGNSSLRGGFKGLSPKYAVSLGSSNGRWTHTLYSVSPGVPGDSGSAFLSRGGKAVGTLSTLGLLPLPASNNIGDLGREFDYAKRHSGLKGLRLAKGTKRFRATP